MASKTYNVTTHLRAAKPRSKRLRGLGVAGVASGGTVIITTAAGGSDDTQPTTPTVLGDGHTHDNLDTLKSLTKDTDDYLYVTQVHGDDDELQTNKVKAGYADDAAHADEADYADVAGVARTFETEDYAEGVTGTGGKIDEDGKAELHSLILREFLEVPELRYNRISVKVGDTWSAPGAGIIKSVNTTTCHVTLKLEDGEIGAVAVGDICRGIWHSTTAADNATSDTDDSKGNVTFAGFITVYFKITAVDADSAGFTYAPRTGYAHHPKVGMHFVAYGNFTNPDRQTSNYSTRTYHRYLTGVNTWEFGVGNIAAQFGDLSNLAVHGLNMTGYSAYLKNIYMSGTVQQTVGGEEIVYCTDRGDWSATPDTPYLLGDSVWHLGGLYVCVYAGTMQEPTDTATQWSLLTKVGSDGLNTATITLYKRASTTPSKPSATLTYTYATGALSGTLSGWSLTQPASNGYPLWSIMARVSGAASTTSILSSAWSTPAKVLVDGTDGIDGLNSATITLYKRAATSPAKPSSALTYTYATGALSGTLSGWLLTQPATDGNPLWSTMVSVSGTAATASIASSAWSTPAKVLMDGTDGNPGSNGQPGCIARTSEWAAGVYYRNDQDIDRTLLDNGVGFLDSVIVMDGTTMHVYMAKAAHNGVASSSSNAPGSTGGATYWQEYNQMQPIYAPMLLAINAIIRLAQSNKVIITDDEGNVCGGLAGGSKSFWIGGESWDDVVSKFKVLADGTAYMSGAVLDSAGDGYRMRLSAGGIKMYKTSGTSELLVANYTGKEYSSLDDIIPRATASMVEALRWTSGATTMLSYTNSSSAAQSVELPALTLVCDPHAGDDGWSCVVTLEIYVGMSTSPVTGNKYFSDSLTLDNISSTRTSVVYTKEIAKYNATNRIITVPAGQTLLVRAQVTVSQSLGYSGVGIIALDGGNIDTLYDYIPQTVPITIDGAATMSHLFGNGCFFGRSPQQYIGMLATTTGTEMIMRNGDFGAKIDADGIKIARRMSLAATYQPVDAGLVYKGIFNYKSTSPYKTITDEMSPYGAGAVITRQAAGQYTVTLSGYGSSMLVAEVTTILSNQNEVPRFASAVVTGQSAIKIFTAHTNGCTDDCGFVLSIYDYSKWQ